MAPKTAILPEGLTRRKFVKNAGGLLIGFSVMDGCVVPFLVGSPAETLSTPPSPDRLDAWMHVEIDGSIRVFTGKTEIGMGVGTGLAQIVAEELDVSPENVSFVMGDTARTADQGGVGGSTSIMQGSKPLRNAAATARYVLMQLASKRLGVPPEQLQVRYGLVSVKGDDTKSVSYGELAGGTDLNDVLKVSGDGPGLNVQGVGKPKDPSSYTVVGKSVLRADMPAKLYGRFQYVTDIRVPGMLHGRVVRPAGVGARIVRIDEAAVKAIPGYVKTVVKGDFVGVVANTEWSAVRCAKALNVTWSDPLQVFGEQKDLYAHMRSVPPKATKVTLKQGDVAGELSNAARKIEASYDFPFQSHATMGPGCAVADVQPDGVTTVWSGGQKPHALQRAFAEMLHVPLDRVRVIWTEDAGSYGRPGFEDAAADAIFLSQAVGKPVRVQWMRSDMTSWGAKGPAVTCDLAAALDAQGEVTALKFTSRAFSGGDVHFLPRTADNFLCTQLSGMENKNGQDEFAVWGTETAPYKFSTIEATSHVVPAFVANGSPMRCTHLRDPEGPATSFATESFMDELAAAAGADPIEFRVKYLEEPRAKAVLQTAAQQYGWERRSSPRKDAGSSGIATGRGVGLSTRNGTYVGTVAEVEVNLSTGEASVTKFVCAHDCGLIVNPEALRATIAANLVQSLSRGLKEEVKFDRSSVTSVDWISYPVARVSDIPPVVEIVLLNHPELPPGGAGEPSSRATAAAIANAIFDATGARVRQAPLTPDRVKAALTSLNRA